MMLLLKMLCSQSQWFHTLTINLLQWKHPKTRKCDLISGNEKSKIHLIKLKVEIAINICRHHRDIVYSTVDCVSLK